MGCGDGDRGVLAIVVLISVSTFYLGLLHINISYDTFLFELESIGYG